MQVFLWDRVSVWTLFTGYKLPAPSVLELHQFSFHIRSDGGFMCTLSCPYRNTVWNPVHNWSTEYSKVTGVHTFRSFWCEDDLNDGQPYPARGSGRLKSLCGFKASCFLLRLPSPDTNVQSMTQLKIFSSGFSSVQTPCQQSPQCCRDVGATMSVCLLNCEWDEC